MACSQFEYVKDFEQHSTTLSNTWMVVRLDGRSFHRFTQEHGFEKPNDLRGLSLANFAARKVMEEFEDIILAYGQSDEFSFVFQRNCQLYQRREAKIVSTVVSLFTSCYVYYWDDFFANDGLKQRFSGTSGCKELQQNLNDGVENETLNKRPDENEEGGNVKTTRKSSLKYPPTFDGRVVCYPTDKNLRDYLSWRQADCHINNLYNTTFWSLVLNEKNPLTERQAEHILKDTDSGKKNELLFSEFNINYNHLPAMFRKGSVLYRKKVDSIEVSKRDGIQVIRKRTRLVCEHVDIIRDHFWNENPQLLQSSSHSLSSLKSKQIKNVNS